jgi:hypothetical protein
MIWPVNVVLARSILLGYVAVALTYGWWYLGTWYWLPKASFKRLFGWALMLASIVVVPISAYREFARRDDIGFTILLVYAVAFIAIMFYRIRRPKAA